MLYVVHNGAYNVQHRNTLISSVFLQKKIIDIEVADLMHLQAYHTKIQFSDTVKLNGSRIPVEDPRPPSALHVKIHVMERRIYQPEAL